MDYIYPRPAPLTTCPNCGCTRVGLVGRLKRLCNGCWRVFVVGKSHPRPRGRAPGGVAR